MARLESYLISEVANLFHLAGGRSIYHLGGGWWKVGGRWKERSETNA